MKALRSSRRGRVNAVTAILMVALTGVALTVGWWYGRGGHGLTAKPTAAAVASHPAKFAKPNLKDPSGQDAPDAAAMILEDRLADIAEQASPAVVSILAERPAEAPSAAFHDDPMFRFFFGPGGPGGQGGPGMPDPQPGPQKGMGSGVIVTADGYILTNNHVVEKATSIRVKTGDQPERPATVVGTDPETDLAVLKVDASDLPTLALADSDKVRVGQVVLAIGAPFGLTQSVTMGIVSARGRTRVGITEFEDFIQTDAAINPGNSGGALLNLAGDVVGINTAIFSQSGGYMGIGFAIPSNLARRVMEGLIEHGRVKRGYLGVQIQDVTPEAASYLKLEAPKGAIVAEVSPDTPAARAGIKVEDVVVAVNGKLVANSTEAMNQIAGLEPDTEATITIVRDGEKIDQTVKLGSRPSRQDLENVKPTAAGGAAETEFAGMRVAELDEPTAQRFGLEPPYLGVVVVAIEPGSRAARSELAVGDLILSVNRRKVVDGASFRSAAEKAGAGPLFLQVRRAGRLMFVAIPQEGSSE